MDAKTLTLEFNKAVRLLDSTHKLSDLKRDDSTRNQAIAEIVSVFRKVRNDAVSEYRKKSLVWSKKHPESDAKVFTRDERFALKAILKNPEAQISDAQNISHVFNDFAQDAIQLVNAARERAKAEIIYALHEPVNKVEHRFLEYLKMCDAA
ncbi:MAG: hypothetical protein AAF182_01290 [Pseudomonadota bacterium]